MAAMKLRGRITVGRDMQAADRGAIINSPPPPSPPPRKKENPITALIRMIIDAVSWWRKPDKPEGQ